MNKTRIIATELLKCDRKFFSLAQIVKITGLNRDVVRDILLTLHSEGFLRRIHKNPEPYIRGKGPLLMNIRYRLITPKKLAQKIAPKFKGENTASDRLWFIIRKKRVFTRRDLRVLTCDMKGQPTMSKETVRWFTKMLARAEIIKQINRGEWILVKDTGPRRPYIGDQTAKCKAHSA